MANTFCGIDFGTSNSTVGLRQAQAYVLAPLEGQHTTLPSAIFYDAETRKMAFGRAAMGQYIEGHEGRLLRALKSVLGTSLMDEKTVIGGKPYAFKDILGAFIKHLKNKAETTLGAEVEQAVFGRPVHFIDGNPSADREAENTLREIATAQGFKHIHFQYEPIAAALDYEQQVVREQLALIVDIGGGTADFSVVRVGPDLQQKTDRSDDILANSGVHIGGTDFDRWLSLQHFMPLLGLGSYRKGGTHPVPTSYYHDLATWHRINQLYVPQTKRAIYDLFQDSAEPQKLARLNHLVENYAGHRLALDVESAKIKLTGNNTATCLLDYLEKGLVTEVTLAEFNAAIAEGNLKIQQTIAEAIQDAGVKPEAIEAVFLTGGSTAIPAVRQASLALTPQARVIEGDLFGSVGVGLALDGQRKFGGN